VELCLKEVQRLDRVVTGVLDLARPPSMELKGCSVHGAIEEALDVLQEQLDRRNIEARTELDAESDVVYGDPEALKSVFINLFLNAAEAMGDGGTLRVSTDSIEPNTNRPGIRVSVADTGSGIPIEDRGEIFHPFFTTKTGGTGLGLSLATRIVEAHQGDLRLAPPSGASPGSTFVMELPLLFGEDG
jgi:signal transduction histidine kinase